MSLVKRNKKRIPPPNFKMTVEKEIILLSVLLLYVIFIKMSIENTKIYLKGNDFYELSI